jgi:hypothetical protein
LFIRPVRDNLPGYIRAQLAQQLRCLELFFNVSVIPGPCDFDRECTLFEPDLVVFESGVYAGERSILNVSSHPDLPRLGFLNADAYCLTRSVFSADMEAWGVRDFFTMSASMAEYFPAIADRMFVWANSIDTSIFHTAAERKNIPVLFTGSQAAHYPWRIRVHDAISRVYPTYVVPRLGWHAQSSHMPQGEDYARLIGQSWFAPACGTIAHEVVRKHFEIPAAGACLLAEPTASLAEAGFVDMENCVLADGHDVLDKLDYLFNRTDELEEIVEAGRALVLGRHTMQNRCQVQQWYRLQRWAGANSRIVQDGPFGDLRVVEASSGDRTRHVVSGGVDRALLKEAAAAMLGNRVGEAESLFLRCLNYHLMPEAILGMARVATKRGEPAQAEDWLAQSITHAAIHHGAPSPDPVEWAWFVRLALCRGDPDLAAERARAYSGGAHPELVRICRVIESLGRTPTARISETNRQSVHDGKHISLGDWVKELCSDLRSCGQGQLASRIEAVPGDAGPGETLDLKPISPPSVKAAPRASMSPVGLSRRLSVMPAVAKRRLWTFARSVKRRNEPSAFFQELTALAARTDVRSAFVCGADPKGLLVSALVRGAAANPGGQISITAVASLADSKSCTGGSQQVRLIERADDASGRIMSLVVAAANCDLGSDWFKLHKPEFVVVEETDRPAGSSLLRSLSQCQGYDTLRNGTDRSGYAVLRHPA